MISMTEQLARAWDEAYLQGYQDRRLERDYDPGQNPHRQPAGARPTTAVGRRLSPDDDKPESRMGF